VILAIESASTDLSIAVAERDGTPIADDAWSGDRRQGHELLPRILELLAQSGRSLEQVSALAVGIGPGSFTGMRVGMSIAKGLAFANGLPIVGIPSLEAWLASRPECVAALARAGAREAYLLERGSREPLIVARDELPEWIGEAPVLAPAELASAFALRAARQPSGAAAALAGIAAQRLAADPAGDDLDRLQPAYLRAPRGIGQQSGQQEGRVKWL
jgi:tRNA threonylcarbamoyladenosine biosynthesis protein TsaB